MAFWANDNSGKKSNTASWNTKSRELAASGDRRAQMINLREAMSRDIRTLLAMKVFKERSQF